MDYLEYDDLQEIEAWEFMRNVDNYQPIKTQREISHRHKAQHEARRCVKGYPCVYLLECEGDDSAYPLIYAGQTVDIEQRIASHLTGDGAGFTKQFPCEKILMIWRVGKYDPKYLTLENQDQRALAVEGYLHSLSMCEKSELIAKAKNSPQLLSQRFLKKQRRSSMQDMRIEPRLEDVDELNEVYCENLEWRESHPFAGPGDVLSEKRIRRIISLLSKEELLKLTETDVDTLFSKLNAKVSEEEYTEHQKELLVAVYEYCSCDDYGSANTVLQDYLKLDDLVAIRSARKNDEMMLREAQREYGVGVGFGFQDWD